MLCCCSVHGGCCCQHCFGSAAHAATAGYPAGQGPRHCGARLEDEGSPRDSHRERCDLLKAFMSQDSQQETDRGFPKRQLVSRQHAGQPRVIVPSQSQSLEKISGAVCRPKPSWHDISHTRQLWLPCRGKEHQGVACVPAPAQSRMASRAGGCREVRGSSNKATSVLHPPYMRASHSRQDVRVLCRSGGRVHFDSPAPEMCIVAACRNWASGARWSGCIAAFRTYPEPNMDPIGYLKVGQAMWCMRQRAQAAPFSSSLDTTHALRLPCFLGSHVGGEGQKRRLS